MTLQTFTEYEMFTETTDLGADLWYYALGLSGEAGEVSEKIKKFYRDQGGKFTEGQKVELAKELGDVLWYLTRLASKIDMPLRVVRL